MEEAKMSAPVPVPVVAVRGSTGISLNHGPPTYDPVTAYTRDDSKFCRAMFFSPDGKYFAWVNHTCVKVVYTSTWKVQCEIARPKVSNATFSPAGTYLITWEPFLVNAEKPEGSPNLNFYLADTGELVRSFVHKNLAGWEPQWNSDESLCARLLNNDVLFYENRKFETSVTKYSPGKVAGFSLSPGRSPSHVAVYLPGQSGQPSGVKLFQYPNFTDVKASKSFFQSDHVDMNWNCNGTAVLVLATSDIDKTGANYYGKQTLQFLSIKGDTALVSVGQGSVHCAQWNPNGNEFCVVYGPMPSKATIFNLKSEAVHHFPPAHRNAIHYNSFGNLLLLGGFGNLPGGIEVWDSNNRRIVSRFDVPETTQLGWSPDGEHFFTATCAPRLREGNGFKIWNYTGKEVYDRPWNKQEELWEVTWQSFPKNTFKEPVIKFRPANLINNTAAAAAKTPYRPPSARLKVEESTTTPTPEALSKSALKQKKRRENKKAKKDEDVQDAESSTSHVPHSNNFGNGLPEGEIPDDPEKQKKIKKLKSKIIEIIKLKDMVKHGKTLELNQLEKIKKEDELVKELKELFL